MKRWVLLATLLALESAGLWEQLRPKLVYELLEISRDRQWTGFVNRGSVQVPPPG